MQFTDTSKNATGWNWDFGDGTNSTEQSPAHIYSSEGTYSANLTVKNADGETNSKTATINVLQATSSSDVGSSGGSGGSSGGSGGSSGGSGGSSGGSGGSIGRANVVSSGSTVNTSAAANVTPTETNTSNIKQSSTPTNVEQTTKQTTEQTPSPNTSGKGSTKASGFETLFGIVSLLVVFLHKRK